MEADSPIPHRRDGLVFGPDDPIPGVPALLVALQQVAAMLVGVITPVLILAQALMFPKETTAYLISMAVVVAGIGTFLQSLRLGPVGAGLLSVTGTSATFIGPLVQAGRLGGLPLMFGMSLAGALVPALLSFFVPTLRRLFPPLVSGIVVLLIGLSLLPRAMSGITAPALAGGARWPAAAVALVVMASVVAAQAIDRSWSRIASVLAGVATGYAACGFMGLLHRPDAASSWVSIPRVFRFGLEFRWELLMPFAFIYLFCMLEAIGVMTATARLSGLETEGAGHNARLRGGLMADGVTSALGAALGSFPNITYAQNNGVIQITGVASRRVGRAMALILVALGLFPPMGLWLSAMPAPVVSGLAILLFGLVAVTGIRLMMGPQLGQREALIIAVSLGAGLGFPSQSVWTEHLAPGLRAVLESNVCAGGLAALALNIALPRARLQDPAETGPL